MTKKENTHKLIREFIILIIVAVIITTIMAIAYHIFQEIDVDDDYGNCPPDIQKPSDIQQDKADRDNISQETKTDVCIEKTGCPNATIVDDIDSNKVLCECQGITYSYSY